MLSEAFQSSVFKRENSVIPGFMRAASIPKNQGDQGQKPGNRHNHSFSIQQKKGREAGKTAGEKHRTHKLKQARQEKGSCTEIRHGESRDRNKDTDTSTERKAHTKARRGVGQPDSIH